MNVLIAEELKKMKIISRKKNVAQSMQIGAKL